MLMKPISEKISTLRDIAAEIIGDGSREDIYCLACTCERALLEIAEILTLLHGDIQKLDGTAERVDNLDGDLPIKTIDSGDEVG